MSQLPDDPATLGQSIHDLLEEQLRPTGPFGVPPLLQKEVMERVWALVRIRGKETNQLIEHNKGLKKVLEQRQDDIDGALMAAESILPRLQQAVELTADIPEDRAATTYLWHPKKSQGITVADLREITSVLAALKDKL